MSNSNDSDKTVFMPPPASANPDRTVIVPTPGGRQAVSQRPNPTGAAATPPLGSPGAQAPGNAYLGTPQNSGPVQLNQGLNPLAKAASTLLTVAIKLRGTVQHNDVPGLHRQLTNEIRAFEQQLKNAGVAPEIVLSARYLLCSVLDEIVLNTPWGANGGWSQHSLLSLFHNETFGGEKCFSILQRMLETPAQNLDILELFYLCLSIGFEGQYRLDPRGQAQLGQIQDHLYQTIANHREHFEPDLSPEWRSDVGGNHKLIHYIPMWVIASCVLVVLLVVYSGFRLWLYQSTDDTASRLTELSRSPPPGDGT